jgi:hypothetical protein
LRLGGVKNDTQPAAYSSAGQMSALGQKQTFCDAGAMSALPPKADMCDAKSNVRLVPKADIATILAFQKTYSRQRQPGFAQRGANSPFQKSGQQV